MTFPRRSMLLLGAAGVIVIVVITILSMKVIEISSERDNALAAAANQATTNKDAAKIACDQVERLNKKCAVDTKKLDSGPQVIAKQGVQGVQGVPGNQGPQGVAGVQGERGATGARGLQGKQGLPGLPGQPGPMGEQGPIGPMGPQGDKGEKGDEGPKITVVACEAPLEGFSFKYTLSNGEEIPVTCTVPSP